PVEERKSTPRIWEFSAPRGRARSNSNDSPATDRNRLKTGREPHRTAATATAAATDTPDRRSTAAAALSVAPVVTMSPTRIAGRPEAANDAARRGATPRLDRAARRRWAAVSPTESGLGRATRHRWVGPSGAHRLATWSK